jgi:hypothetical protein
MGLMPISIKCSSDAWVDTYEPVQMRFFQHLHELRLFGALNRDANLVKHTSTF